jgi:hypothetical protein
MFQASLRSETKDTGFATKCENLFACIQYFSMCLAAAEKVLWPIICRLSSNNRPITDYLKNGRLISFADYLPINRLIPIHNTNTEKIMFNLFHSRIKFIFSRIKFMFCRLRKQFSNWDSLFCRLPDDWGLPPSPPPHSPFSAALTCDQAYK